MDIAQERISQRPGRWSRLHWANRAGLVLAASVAFVVLALSLIAVVAVGRLSFWRFDEMLLAWDVVAVAAVAIPVWAFLRVFDLVVRGVLWTGRIRHARQEQRAGYPLSIKTQMGWH